jgi:hypothetical protein
VNGNATETLSTGGIVTTDPSGIGATIAAPFQTEVTSYAGGLVDISTEGWRGHPPIPYGFLHRAVHLVAPSSPNTATPQIVKFRIDASKWDQAADRLRLFRDGELVRFCTDADFVAVPDPCSTRAVRLSDGDVQITVYAMSPAGTWNFAWRLDPFDFSFAKPTAGPPVVNVVPSAKGSTPTFFTLGGNRGLEIFHHSPWWRRVPCWSNARERSVTRPGDVRLSYDPFSDEYEYTTFHPASWKGTCRVLTLPFQDGTIAHARYRFR